ncbi:uncharacterized protein (DUF924 family) [Rhodopseudomonas julia]|uniref:Uncharacterized protein (DUF924 family) n=1 Tax=Rhodopseudomonas julia TaxID=200617 RepID=A0ABU0C5K1_9BRAD|nr:DUF924 family protein [Rhodopseudomonas julia]MDQ0325797.1 uncharacterized protein (DUF924 family) [Rhodopseudomonas julia]
MAPTNPGPQDVIAFWREAGPEKWFKKSDAFDREIGERFGALHEAASKGALEDWAETPDGALALILLLDQFSRNLYRKRPEAFATDPEALRLAKEALSKGYENHVPADVAKFFVMPFMHSESLAEQDRCVALSHRLDKAGTLSFALEHREIIRRFARFPHRNAVLHRHTSPAERRFLEDGGFSG